ncbi:MAG: flagellar filament capping protein FliD [Bdellovibrionales bacterium]
MAGVRLSGFSGAIPPNLVDQLVEAEKIPVKQLEKKKLKEEDTLKLVGDLETKIQEIPKNLGELLNSKGFSDLKLISGDENIIAGSVDPNAAPTGEYGIEVIQLAQKPGAMTSGFPDRDKSQVGVGYIKFNTPEGMKEIYINSENSTLDGVANAINRSNTGLRANVIEDRKDTENPFRLIVSGLATGSDKNVTFPTVYMLDGDRDLYFDQERPSQNAKVKIDGFEVELPENKVDKLIPGVTLDLKSAAPGREIKVFVKEDLEKISGKIKNFVEAYNGALGFIQGQAKLQKSSDGREKLGPLGGDSLLRSIENTLRRVIQNPPLGVQGDIKRLNQIGIEFNRNGTLNFSEEKFNAALKSDTKSMIAFLRGDGFATGFVPGVRREISNIMNGQFGAISNRKKALSDKVNRINKQIENKERQIEKKEDQLRKKFADMETKLSQIQNQGQAFKAMGGGVGGASAGG